MADVPHLTVKQTLLLAFAAVAGGFAIETLRDPRITPPDNTVQTAPDTTKPAPPEKNFLFYEMK